MSGDPGGTAAEDVNDKGVQSATRRRKVIPMHKVRSTISCCCVMAFIVCMGHTTFCAQSLTRDPVAIQIALLSDTAMGSDAALASSTSRATAQVTLAIDDPPSYSLVYETGGTQRIRRTTQSDYGSVVRIVNTGVGQLTMNGIVTPLPLDSTIGERVRHIPALSLIAEVSNPSLEVTYEGSEAINGSVCDRISISQPLIGDPQQADAFRELTKTTFWIDQETRFVLKEAHTERNINPTPGTYRVELYFANYRQVQGVAVPFTQVTFVDGQPVSEVAISAVQFNAGVPDSDFELQGGQ